MRGPMSKVMPFACHPHSVEKGGPRLPYDPDVIDYFFIVDGDLAMHLIPSQVVAGRVSRAADIQEVHRWERGGAAWCGCGRDGRGRVTLGVNGLRWRRLGVC
jgi:hypothetical protein